MAREMLESALPTGTSLEVYQRVREDDFGRVFEGAAFSWGRRRSSVRAITKELLMIEQDTIKQALY